MNDHDLVLKQPVFDLVPYFRKPPYVSSVIGGTPVVLQCHHGIFETWFQWVWDHFQPRFFIHAIYQSNGLGKSIIYWLVVWNIFLFFHIFGISIPTDELIFFRGVETTNQFIIFPANSTSMARWIFPPHGWKPLAATMTFWLNHDPNKSQRFWDRDFYGFFKAIPKKPMGNLPHLNLWCFTRLGTLWLWLT